MIDLVYILFDIFKKGSPSANAVFQGALQRALVRSLKSCVKLLMSMPVDDIVKSLCLCASTLFYLIIFLSFTVFSQSFHRKMAQQLRQWQRQITVGD